MSRQRKYNDAAVAEIMAAFEEYIAETDDPIIARFLSYDSTALKYWMTDDDFTHYKQFRPLVLRALKKQEAYVLSKGMNGQATAMSIFRLKQPYFGYKDRTEQDITSNGEKITFNNVIPRPLTLEEKKAAKAKKK